MQCTRIQNTVMSEDHKALAQQSGQDKSGMPQKSKNGLRHWQWAKGATFCETKTKPGLRDGKFTALLSFRLLIWKNFWSNRGKNPH